MIKLSKYLSLIFCFLLIFCSKVFSSEIVNDILIKGNERISSETIKMFSDVQLNQEINDDNLNETDKYKLIKLICKYISIFHTIHEHKIELIMFTNNAIDIFNKTNS